jgi:hypothetical protein
VITRAAVFSMTVTSGLIGGLLAIGAMRLTGEVTVDWALLALAIVGLVVAHAANNMINDYFDLEGGIDTDDYVRALYAPHPILSGWVTKRQLGAAILIANAIDLAILLVLMSQRGPLVDRVRARRAVRLGVLRGPADPPQAHRPRRARRVRGRWARYSRRSSFVTTPAALAADRDEGGRPVGQQRERLVERRGWRVDERQRRLHHLADRPLDDVGSRNARSSRPSR